MSITFTRWKFENINTLEQFAKNLTHINRELIEIEWDEPPKYEVTGNIEEYGYDHVYNAEIEDTNIRYLSFNVIVERAKKKEKWVDENGQPKERRDKINIYKCNMLAFKEHGNIILVALAAKTTVKIILRHAFNEELWGTISEVITDINEDIFYWLLKRLRDYPTAELHNSTGITISGLWSYLGTTCDGSNAFRAKGRRVLAVLGTLAVIFSSEELKALRLEFQHDGDLVVIELNLNNTIKIYDDYYLGKLNVYTGQEKNDKLVLYVIKLLIPKILSAYKGNIEDNLWSIELKLDFLRTIGQEIKDRVEEELKILEADSQDEDDEIKPIELLENIEDNELEQED